VYSQTQHPLRKSLTQTLKETTTIATTQRSCGSLQICASGFKVCNTKQTYVTMFHTLVSNYAPKKQAIYHKNI
jgi:hypothetical protein